jgi:cytochrome c556
MRISRILLCSLASLALCFGEDDHHKFHEGMEASGKAMGDLRKAMQASDMKAAATAAKPLPEIYTFVEKYFAEHAKKDAALWSDAAKWSTQAKAASMALVKAAESGDQMATGAAMRELGGTCKSCHDVHREKTPEGKYKFKHAHDHH